MLFIVLHCVSGALIHYKRHAIRYIVEGYYLVFSRSAVEESDADSKKEWEMSKIESQTFYHDILMPLDISLVEYQAMT